MSIFTSILQLIRLAVFALLVSAAVSCASYPDTPPPRYVWYCHIAGGGGCIGEMIRCWDSKAVNWTADSDCAAVEKPENLVHNQSFPPVSRSALFPGR